IIIVVAGLLVGFARGEIEQQALLQYRPLLGHVVTLHGIVTDDTSYGPGGDERLSLGSIVVNGVSLNGRVWISAETSRTIQRSDQVVLKGQLGPGFGSMSASMFRASILKVVRPRPGDIGLHVRDWFAGGIRTAIPEPDASLASG